MGTKEEIRQLFQQFIDGAITEEGLTKFYSYADLQGTHPEIHRLLAEFWGYVELTGYVGDGGMSGEEIEAAIEKIIKS